MSESKGPAAGTIGWVDLTVANAEELRDFYSAVIGWSTEPVSMGDYEDFSMVAPGAGAVAGVCHARGANASMPGHWMVYFVVDDLEQSMGTCRDRGGSILVPPRGEAAQGRFCVIRDPAGAVAALYQPGK